MSLEIPLTPVGQMLQNTTGLLSAHLKAIPDAEGTIKTPPTNPKSEPGPNTRGYAVLKEVASKLQELRINSLARKRNSQPLVIVEGFKLPESK